jgi:hypothetical protein
MDNKLYNDICTSLLAISKQHTYNMIVLIDFDDFIDNIDYFSSIKESIPHFISFFKGKNINSCDNKENFIPLVINQMEQIHNSYVNKLVSIFNQENPENQGNHGNHGNQEVNKKVINNNTKGQNQIEDHGDHREDSEGDSDGESDGDHREDEDHGEDHGEDEDEDDDDNDDDGDHGDHGDHREDDKKDNKLKNDKKNKNIVEDTSEEIENKKKKLKELKKLKALLENK